MDTPKVATYPTRTRTRDGQLLRDVFEGPDGWSALVTGTDTEAGRNLAAAAIDCASGGTCTPTEPDLDVIGADRFGVNFTLYIVHPA